jgi:tetratricopeptide (TPR) repeat protein
MKRTAVFLAVLAIAVCAAAQNSGQAAPQNPPASGQAQQTPPASGQPAPAAAPQGKRPPQLKTKPEQDAYTAAAASTDAGAMEKAADDFAVKFPDSEVRVLLYKNTMRLYRNANNAEKVEAMGRKLLAIDGDDPEGLVTVSEVIAERTRDSDLDKDQRYDEAIKMAQKATQTVDTDISVPANATPEQVEAYKAELKSQAYSTIGIIDFKKDNYPAAQENLQKSIDAYPQDPDPIVVLRLAIALDKQEKYPDALKVANHAVDLTQNNAKMPDQVKTMAKQERDRLQQLTRSAAPAPASEPPKN